MEKVPAELMKEYTVIQHRASSKQGQMNPSVF